MRSKLYQIAFSWVCLAFIPKVWRMPCFALLGVFAGLGLATGQVSRAVSYMSEAPEVCANCHVMATSYATWRHSSHARVAVCIDCHLPHDTFIHKMSFKARDGIYHSTIFALRLEPQVIRMSQAAIPVVEENCRRCHADIVHSVALAKHQPGDLRCWDCHRETPHGFARNLSTTPRINHPQLPDPVDFTGGMTIGGRNARPDRG